MMTDQRNLDNMINQKNYNLLMKKFSSYHPEIIQSYLQCYFKTYSSNQASIDFLSFYNFLSWPFFLAEKLFNAFKVDKYSSTLEEGEFLVGLNVIYGQNTLEDKGEMVFEFLDFNNDGIIKAEDANIVLAQFLALTNVSELKEANDIIKLFFEEKEEMSLAKFKEIIIKSNADLVYLMLFFMFHYQPYDENAVDYYIELMCNADQMDNFSAIPIKSDLCYPTYELYSFFANNYDMNFSLEDNELDELENFEESLSQITSALTDNHIIKDQEHFDDNQKKDRISLSIFDNERNRIFKQALQRINSHGSSSNNNNDEDDDKLSLHQGNNCTHSCLLFPIQNYKESNNSLQSKPFITTCYETNKNRDLIKRKITIVGKDAFIFKYLPKEKNVHNEHLKLSRILPLKQCYIQEQNPDDNDTNSSSNEERNDCKLVLVLTHQNKPVEKTLYFRNQAKRNKISDYIKSINNQRKPEDEYEYIQRVGKGTFGLIVKAKNKQTNEIVALKILEKPYFDDKNGILEIIYRERDISRFLMTMHHDGIVAIKDIIETYTNVIIVQEYIMSGTLQQYFDHTQPSIDQSYDYLRQLITSINFLHHFGIVHRDLKTDNVLISYHKSSGVTTKIIDFSFTRVLGSEELLVEKCGTLLYIPPEMILNESYSKNIDIWSLGIMGYYLITGSYPFNSVIISELTSQIMTKEILFISDCSSSKSRKSHVVKNIIRECLQRDRSERIDISELMEIISVNN